VSLCQFKDECSIYELHPAEADPTDGDYRTDTHAVIALTKFFRILHYELINEFRMKL